MEASSGTLRVSLDSDGITSSEVVIRGIKGKKLTLIGLLELGLRWKVRHGVSVSWVNAVALMSIATEQ